MTQSSPETPRNAVVVLLDSLNRHMLGCYGAREFDTPNLDRFAARAVRFTRHYAGSLPCMPARHDILCGAMDFLWRPWGSIEVWEDAITHQLRLAGVTTMLVSDHPHLFETGGENYHTDFTAWDYLRGHEGDPWKTRPDPSAIGAPELPEVVRRVPRAMPYDTSRTYFRRELDFPGPRVMSTAARWIEQNAGFHDRFLLFIDEFDPHEPFDTPEPYASMYDPAWSGPKLIWPPYAVRGVERGVLTEREGRQLRASYGGKLTMIDAWFGRLLEAIDTAGLGSSTLIVLCTDHGHYLGEKDVWGKPGVPLYEPLGHTPLLVAHPGVEPGTCDALTANVDLFATLADLFGVRCPQRTHGRSMLPLLRGETRSIRDWLLAGIWGRHVHVIDGKRKYARGPVGDNFPLSMWSNRWSTMPIHAVPELRLPRPDKRARLDFMPGSEVPVIRQPFEPGDPIPYWGAQARPDEHVLFDLEEDPHEEQNLVGSQDEKRAIELLRSALDAVEAPSEQLVRLGIA
jgi:arylsulfatase A-like enzyme